MNLAGENFPAFNAYNGKVAYEIYVSGCDRNCPDCHNPDFQQFCYGEEISKKTFSELISRMNEVRGMFEVIAILGGDLLSHSTYNASTFVMMLRGHFRNKEFWLFTGAESCELPEYAKEMFHVIKVGKYIKELHQEGFPSSWNQRLLFKGVDY